LNMHHNIMENNKEHYKTCLGDLSMHDKWSSIWLLKSDIEQSDINI
jgi:hypothetical protein